MESSQKLIKQGEVRLREEVKLREEVRLREEVSIHYFLKDVGHKK